jgi:anaerobic ribonucleoside-triphosphate reductase activating protein
MKYSGLIKNDIVNGQGVCVSLFVQGCPHKCPGCFNPETWNPEEGIEIPVDLKGQIIKAISANGIIRNFSILGGEPLAPYNLEFVNNILTAVKAAYPQILIYLWTGYTLEELAERKQSEDVLYELLNKVDILIDGPFIEEQKDLTLPLRGSKNQRVIKLKEIDF